MCGKTFSGNVNYELTSKYSNTTLYICKKCAIREYYGTKAKIGKKWKTDQANNKLFGKPIDNRN